ncbi:hypothetical protein [Sporosarcina sp. JAI121]|uniref:hypothetical protein n=1 Tax=Sporosarcina sp. JAI121 TaxID=2723064 RepID=UPI0015CECC5B|nr:hypothetical protein [Sporosarcina sp. JAI121]NYF23556.1 hypothetical protein [Sporosarcina sp. JAI121]
MLTVQVNNNRRVQVSFDVTGDGDGAMTYYIREVKLKLDKKFWDTDSLGAIKNAVSYEIPHHSLPDFAETRSEYSIRVRLERLIGFTSLSYFQPAIEEQYNELMIKIRKWADEEKPIQLEMILDVIY